MPAAGSTLHRPHASGAAARMASDHSMQEVEAVIFAGGASSSMFPLTETVPKCALPVMGRPLINYQLAVLSAANVRTVHIITFADARSQLGLALDALPHKSVPAPSLCQHAPARQRTRHHRRAEA